MKYDYGIEEYKMLKAKQEAELRKQQAEYDPERISDLAIRLLPHSYLVDRAPREHLMPFSLKRLFGGIGHVIGLAFCIIFLLFLLDVWPLGAIIPIVMIILLACIPTKSDISRMHNEYYASLALFHYTMPIREILPDGRFEDGFERLISWYQKSPDCTVEYYKLKYRVVKNIYMTSPFLDNPFYQYDQWDNPEFWSGIMRRAIELSAHVSGYPRLKHPRKFTTPPEIDARLKDLLIEAGGVWYKCLDTWAQIYVLKRKRRDQETDFRTNEAAIRGAYKSSDPVQAKFLEDQLEEKASRLKVINGKISVLESKLNTYQRQYAEFIEQIKTIASGVAKVALDNREVETENSALWSEEDIELVLDAS